MGVQKREIFSRANPEGDTKTAILTVRKCTYRKPWLVLITILISWKVNKLRVVPVWPPHAQRGCVWLKSDRAPSINPEEIQIQMWMEPINCSSRSDVWLKGSHNFFEQCTRFAHELNSMSIKVMVDVQWYFSVMVPAPFGRKSGLCKMLDRPPQHGKRTSGSTVGRHSYHIKTL